MRTIVHLMGMTSYKLGGVENFILKLIDRCPDDKFYLVYNERPYSDSFFEQLKNRNVELIVCKTGDLGVIGSFNFSKFIKSLNPDIIHFHFESNAKIAFFIKKIFCSKVKVYRTIHSEIYISTSRFVDKMRYVKNYLWWHFFASCIDCFICVSNHVATQLRDIYKIKKKTLTIYLGVEPSVDLNLSIKKDKKIVTNIGFSNPIKGVDIFIESLTYVDYNDYEAWIIGLDENIDYTQKLKFLAKKLGVYDKIRWLGIVDNASQYLQYSDVFCQTSRTEALSLAACEALMCGCSVIGSNVGGLPEVAQMTFEVGDSKSLGELINKILSDVEYSERLKKEAIQKWESKFKLERGVNAYRDLYI